MSLAATGLIFFGYLFAFYAIPLMGVDLLIDAVGFLFIFNGVRALRKMGPGFGGGPICCLLLVAVSAVQLFFGGAELLLLSVARAALEALLAVALATGFGRRLGRGGKFSFLGLLGGLAFGFYALVALMRAILMLLNPFADDWVRGNLQPVAQLMVLVALVLLCLPAMPRREKPPANARPAAKPKAPRAEAPAAPPAEAAAESTEE